VRRRRLNFRPFQVLLVEKIVGKVNLIPVPDAEVQSGEDLCSALLELDGRDNDVGWANIDNDRAKIWGRNIRQNWLAANR
jgi:hypothetical protein